MTAQLLVVSAFEAELQPLASACAAAALRQAEANVTAWDIHMFPDPPPEISPRVVLLSVQQFEGIERALTWAPKLRAAYPDAMLLAFGQYAQMNSRLFLDRVHGVIMDEPERIAEP